MRVTVSKTQPYLVRQTVIDSVFQVLGRALPRHRRGEVSVVFVDNRKMSRLNGRYRGKPRVTDVLSFAERESPSFGHAEQFIGEIIIAYPYVTTQARQQGKAIHTVIAGLQSRLDRPPAMPCQDRAPPGRREHHHAKGSACRSEQAAPGAATEEPQQETRAGSLQSGLRVAEHCQGPAKGRQQGQA